MPVDGSDILSARVVSETRGRVDLSVVYVYGGGEGDRISLTADACAPREDFGYFMKARVPARKGRHTVRLSIRYSAEARVPAYYRTTSIGIALDGRRGAPFVLRGYRHERSWCRKTRDCVKGDTRRISAARAPLAERLLSPEATVRVAAAQEAVLLPPEAKRDLRDDLSEHLIDPEVATRNMALLALEGLAQADVSSERESLGAALRRLLRLARETIGGTAERASIPPLVDALIDADPGRRAFADEALRRIAASPDPPAADIDVAVVEARGGNRDARTARTLVAGLRCDRERAYAAQQTLAAFGTDALVVRGRLVALAERTDGEPAEREVALLALRVLARTHTAVPAMVPRLRALMRDDTEFARDAIAVLGSLGPAAAAAVPDLAARMPRGKQVMYPTAEADALADIGPASVPVLLPVSRESDTARRAAAVYALARLSGNDARAADRVADALDEKDPQVAMLARRGIEASGPERRALARPLFARLLRHGGRALERAQRRTDMNMVASAWPISPAELYTPMPGKDIVLMLSRSTAPVASERTVYLNLAVRNISSHPIRLLAPRCSVLLDDPVELLVFAEPGWPLLRPAQAAPDSASIIPKEFNSTRLAPWQEVTFACLLQDPEKLEKISFSTGVWGGSGIGRFPRGAGEWFFDPLSGRDAPANRLRPGRYRVRARYRLSADDAKRSHFTQRHGRLWTGEADSNELVLDVL